MSAHLEDGVAAVRHDGGVVPRICLLARGGRGRTALLPLWPSSAGVQVSGHALPSERALVFSVDLHFTQVSAWLRCSINIFSSDQSCISLSCSDIFGQVREVGTEGITLGMSIRFCSPVVPVLPLHRRAHCLEVRLAAEFPDVP